MFFNQSTSLPRTLSAVTAWAPCPFAGRQSCLTHLCVPSGALNQDLEGSLDAGPENPQLTQVATFMAGYSTARLTLRVRGLRALLPPRKLACIYSAMSLAGIRLFFGKRLALLELPTASLDSELRQPLLLAGVTGGNLQQQSPYRLVISTRRRACYLTVLARGGLVEDTERVVGPFSSAITLSHKVAIYAYGLKKPRAVNRVAMGLVAKLLRRFLVTLDVRSLSVVLRGLPAGLNFF